MGIYILLSVISICTTFVICFYLNNIQDYQAYKEIKNGNRIALIDFRKILDIIRYDNSDCYKKLDAIKDLSEQAMKDI